MHLRQNAQLPAEIETPTGIPLECATRVQIKPWLAENPVQLYSGDVKGLHWTQSSAQMAMLGACTMPKAAHNDDIHIDEDAFAICFAIPMWLESAMSRWRVLL